MANNFSIEEAASDTRITRKPGILVKIFRGLLLSQFKEIKHGCIVLNDGEERIVFGDENVEASEDYKTFTIKSFNDLKYSGLNVFPCVANFLINVLIISKDILDNPLFSLFADKS